MPPVLAHVRQGHASKSHPCLTVSDGCSCKIFLFALDTLQSLAEAIKFDHGYTAASPVGRALLEVLAELEPADQRRFLRFVTGGCPVMVAYGSQRLLGC